MFGWFRRPEVVEFVKIEGRSLTFKSTRSYKLRARPTVQMDIPDPLGEKREFKLPVTITNIRQVAKGQYIYSGVVPGAAQSVEQLRQLLEGLDPTAGYIVESDESFANMRRSPRYPWSIRILSKDLVGFRGISIDFNKLGLKLAAEGPTEIGAKVSMTLEVETSSVPELLCQGVVKWQREAGRRRFEIGVEFVDLDPEVAKQLEDFEKFLEERQTDNISKRQVLDTGLYADSAFGPGVEAEAAQLAAQKESAAEEAVEEADDQPEAEPAAIADDGEKSS